MSEENKSAGEERKKNEKYAIEREDEVLTTDMMMMKNEALSRIDREKSGSLAEREEGKIKKGARRAYIGPCGASGELVAARV